MRLHSYLGGITVKPRREQSKNCEIISLVPENDMVYPLVPYKDKKPAACVQVGDRVKIGQQLAAAGDGTMGIYSSVSGVVKAVEDRMNSDLKTYKSVVIENDGMFEEGEFDEVVELEQLNFKQLLNLIGAYGIREYNKTGIPLYEKLKPAGKTNVEWVIVNGVECEPYFTSIYRRFMDDPDMVIDGIKVMKHMFPNAEVVVAIGDDKMDAVIEIEKRTKNEPGVEIVAIPNKYPSGEVTHLIFQITGKKYRDEMQAISDGIVCIQADTLCAVYSAVFEGVPPMSRVITVSGSECVNPGNYEVLFGTSVDEIIKLSGGEKNETYMVVAGGPFTGNIEQDLSVPVTANVEGIFLLSKKDAPIYEPEDCISCGRCVSACPNHLVPQKLLKYAKSGNMEKFLKWYGDSCILCGCCTYVCPAHIPLTGYFAETKDILEKKGARLSGR